MRILALGVPKMGIPVVHAFVRIGLQSKQRNDDVGMFKAYARELRGGVLMEQLERVQPVLVLDHHHETFGTRANPGPSCPDVLVVFLS